MKNSPGNKLKHYRELSKLKIMIPVCLTGFTGFFVFDPRLSASIFYVTGAILLLSVAASVLNQLQETQIDIKMSRTMNRPLPAGNISKANAIIFFLFNLISGVLILFAAGNLKAATIGLITILWYNIIYTYAKRITAFAVVPGAITGSLPPLIGWVAAGGGVWDRPIIFIEFLFFTGQIPHFWLMILKYGEEYKKAGMPSLTEVFSTNQINRLTFIWALSSIFAAIFLCYFGIIRSGILIIILLVASAFTIWKFSDLIRIPVDRNNYTKYSMLLYLYFLVVMVLLISDRVIG